MGILIGDLAGYPLDGFSYTGIRRLKAYQLIQDGRIPGHFRLPPGALLKSEEISLRLTGNPDFDVTGTTAADPALQFGVEKLLKGRDRSYRLALLDITDPINPRYAGVRENQGYIPGSVGKLLVMTGVFDQLRDRFPGDLEARASLLRDRVVAADRFVIPNSHAVPVVAPDFKSVTHRPIQVGDRFSLWEWIDHMVSPSSNAAGSMVWKEVLLMDAFGEEYPVDTERQAAFLSTTARTELGRRAVELIEEPLLAADLNPEQFRIRTFFTSTASAVIPGQSSYSTPLGILRWLIRLEQGRLVDRWSSLEMKKLIYFTRRRYRYASAPALDKAAVFFKSGSLYRCTPEPGYECGQYRGNAENLMHSVAIIESPRDQGRTLVYLVSIMSNVLKTNSAWEHMQLASEIEKLVRARNS